MPHRPTRTRDSAPVPEELEDHDRGLDHDLPRILSRRGALGLIGGVGAAALVSACGVDTGTAPTWDRGAGGMGGAPAGDSTVDVADGEIPEETAGPYPGDGSNGVNVLQESGVVRSDITTSFGDASAVASGVPLTIDLTLVDLSGDGSVPLAGAAVYLWHCDAAGRYSLYSDEVAEENYLRGVQESDGDGRIRFTSIFPGCYSGRWPHIHFEVYPSLHAATSAQNKMRTSQIALPAAVARKVYADSGYAGSAENLAAISLDSDTVFADGWSLQMAKVTGSADTGLTARLSVPV